MKYYIEIYETKNNEYCIQSEWMDTIQEALEWYNKISFKKQNLSIALMSGTFDKDNNLKDIFCEKIFND